MIKRINGEQGVVFQTEGSFFVGQGWPTVCRDENGTLYAVASSFRIQHICPFGKTAMFISRNNGKTWTKPIIINDSYLDDRDAGILYLGNGKILVTWFDLPADSYYQGRFHDFILNEAAEREKPLIEGMFQSCSFLKEEDQRGGSYVMLSDDYGLTWSEKIRVPISSPHGPNLCADGTLIYLGQVLFPCDGEEYYSIVAYASSDGGRTWERRGLCDKPAELSWEENFSEPHVIELPDGTLLGAIRAESDGIYGEDTPYGYVENGKAIFTTRSTDKGRTWSAWERLPVNGAPAHLMLDSSGALICTYCRRTAPTGQRVIVSRDGGKTWSDEYILAEAPHPDTGYPSTVELDDGSFLTVYYESFLETETQCRNSAVRYVKWRFDEKP